MEIVIINRAIKYRIYPNAEQQNQLARTFGCVRKVFNMGLELRQGLYANGMGSTSNWDLNTYCNHVWKEELPYLREVDKFALTNSLLDLGAAFKNFFEKRAGYPKFKSRREHYRSYSTNATNNNIAVRGNGKKGQVKLPKLGWVSANIHRQPNADWKIKSATVSQNAAGKYFVSVLFEIQHSFDVTAPAIEKTIGLDYSSPHFYVSSDGEKADMPHYYRRAEARLAKEQRRLSRMVKGSKNYEQQRRLVAILHEQIASQRKDFCHKLSRKITNSYDVVCVEDIDLRGLAGTLKFGKATNDNGFGMFRTFLKYKLEENTISLSTNGVLPLRPAIAAGHTTLTSSSDSLLGFVPTAGDSMIATSMPPLIFETKATVCLWSRRPDRSKYPEPVGTPGLAHCATAVTVTVVTSVWLSGKRDVGGLAASGSP